MREYFKLFVLGTLLQEIIINQPPTKITCEVIDTQDIIQCDESDVEPLTKVLIYNHQKNFNNKSKIT